MSEFITTVQIGDNALTSWPGSKQLLWNGETFADMCSPEAAQFVMLLAQRAEVPACFGLRSWRPGGCS